ncbi:MAG TPA: hypothetical protein VGL81_28755 [Polyangiaceae bacterium]
MTVTFVGALIIGAYAAGCGSGDATGTGDYGSYHGGEPATGSGSGSGGSSSGSSSGSTSSSGGSSGSSGSSSGSSSGGTAEAGAPPVEAGPAPLTLDEAFAQFASCMSYTNFTTKGASGAAASDIAKSQTTQYGDCNACHNAGDGGFWASYGTVQGQNMTQTMFQQTQMFPYIAKWVTGTVDASGNFKDLAPSNAIADQATLASQCTAGTPCHPKFQLDPAIVQAISDFVTTTITDWHNNTCTGSGLPSDAGMGEGG